MVEPTAPRSFSAILVGPNPDRLAVISSALDKNNVQHLAVADNASAIRLARKHKPDFVFVPIDLPDSGGAKLIQKIKKELPLTFGVVLGPVIPDEARRGVLDEGADAYLETDEARPENLVPDMARLVARKQIGFIGKNEKILQIIETIETIAPTKVTVLITGESGTGKELIARAIHDRSNRRDKPFIAVNCAALPQGTLESELFGHEKGSFTGAIAQRKGRFEIANGGTLLLDEVGEMPAGTQVKLLRVLEEERFMRVGGSQDVSVDVRVLAATNRDLRQLVEEGSFRIDLFYRLNVVPIHVPPLRERREDIAAIFLSIVYETSRRNGLKPVPVQPETLLALTDYSWPGNVRELRNLGESLVVLAGGKEITLASLPEQIVHAGEARDLPVVVTRPRNETERDLYLWRLGEIERRLAENTGLLVGIRDTLERISVLGKQPVFLSEDGSYSGPSEGSIAAGVKPGAKVRDMERQLIEKTLKAVSGNRKKAARMLGMGERTLYRRMKEYGLT